jgi:hypothetical protein
VLGVTVRPMSDRELVRLEVLQDLDRRRLTTAAAAQLLGLGRCQVSRLLRAYRSEGPAGLISKRRGRSSNRRKPEAVRTEALSIIREVRALEPYRSRRGTSLEWGGPRKRGCVGCGGRRQAAELAQPNGRLRQASHLGQVPVSKRRPRCRSIGDILGSPKSLRKWWLTGRSLCPPHRLAAYPIGSGPPHWTSRPAQAVACPLPAAR